MRKAGVYVKRETRRHGGALVEEPGAQPGARQLTKGAGVGVLGHFDMVVAEEANKRLNLGVVLRLAVQRPLVRGKSVLRAEDRQAGEWQQVGGHCGRTTHGTRRTR